MEKLITSMESSLTCVDDLIRGVEANPMPDAAQLSFEVNSFVDSLKVMNKAGASIGPDSNVPTFPVELLRYLEGEQNNTICNPDLFQGKLLEECEKSAVEVAQKIERLQMISSEAKLAMDQK